MKTVKAKISWFFEEKRIPPIIQENHRKTFRGYGPIIIFKNQYEGTNPILNPILPKWSSVVFNEKINGNETISTLTYLSEKAPFELLKLDAEFELFEGPNKVAHGVIIGEFN